MAETVKLVTPTGSVRFPNLTEHESFGGVSTEKYSITLAFDQEAVGPISKALEEAGSAAVDTIPLRQMDPTAQYDAGMFMLKAKSKYPINAVGRDRESIPLADVTHGSKARAQVVFSLYEIGGRKGIAAYLNGVQLVEGASSDQWPDDLPDMLEDDYVDVFNK